VIASVHKLRVYIRLSDASTRQEVLSRDMSPAKYKILPTTTVGTAALCVTTALPTSIQLLYGQNQLSAYITQTNYCRRVHQRRHYIELHKNRDVRLDISLDDITHLLGYTVLRGI